jgi:hypothetical protein
MVVFSSFKAGAMGVVIEIRVKTLRACFGL